MRVYGLCAIAIGCVVLPGSLAMGQYETLDDHAVPTQAVSATNASLGSILNRLDRLEAKDEPKEECEWEDVSGEKWTSKFGGRIMADYVMWGNEDPGYLDRFGNFQNYMEFRRLRTFFEGEGYGVYIYCLQLDFEPEGISLDSDSGVSLKDVYVGMKEVPFFGTVYMGNKKAPMSIEELTSSKYITFMERALPNIFAPSRQVGITAINTGPGEAIGWGMGAYFNDIDQVDKEQIGDAQGISLIGRLWGTPYYCEGGRHLFHLGASGGWFDDRDNRVRWRSRPEVHEGRPNSGRTIDSGLIGADSYYTAQCEAALVWGRASLQGEFFYNSVSTVNQSTLDFYGAYAQASWFLTGENRVYERAEGCFGRVKPFTNFWIVRDCDGMDVGWGGWELAARWSYLDTIAGPSNNAGQQNDLTVGVNWYWNPHTRFMFNWIHPMNDYNVASGGGFTDGYGDIFACRLQVDF